MLEHLPVYIPVIFAITSVITLLIFYWVIKNSEEKSIKENSNKIILVLIIWLAIQAIISINNTYSNDTNSLPPKIFMFGILPSLVMLLWLFFSKAGKRFIDHLSIEKLTYLNLVRIPVEFVLLWLFQNKFIPKLMTFEGWNFDIIMGITAPIIIYFGFVRQKLNRKILVIWNVIGVLLVGFIFIVAILSAPFPLQQLGFEQPNVGLLYFPFSWLPTFIVPLVILGHLISIRQLLLSKK